MTQDEIIRMAHEAGFGPKKNDDHVLYKALECFAALVAEATKEKVAKVCDDLYKHDRKSSGYDEGWNDALDYAEQAIRSMK